MMEPVFVTVTLILSYFVMYVAVGLVERESSRLIYVVFTLVLAVTTLLTVVLMYELSH